MCSDVELRYPFGQWFARRKWWCNIHSRRPLLMASFIDILRFSRSLYVREAKTSQPAFCSLFSQKKRKKPTVAHSCICNDVDIALDVHRRKRPNQCLYINWIASGENKSIILWLRFYDDTARASEFEFFNYWFVTKVDSEHNRLIEKNNIYIFETFNIKLNIFHISRSVSEITWKIGQVWYFMRDHIISWNVLYTYYIILNS